MHRVWAKIVVAGLVILGEGALASEISQRSDDRYESGDNPAVISQPVILDDPDSSWNPVPAYIDAVRPQTSLTYHKVAAVSVFISDPFEYHPFNPRAPPVPAS